VAQRLLPRSDDTGRVAAVEVLTANAAVRGILRDPERLGALRVVMLEGGEEGMQAFEQHLAQLQEQGVITAEAAAALGGPERKTVS
jgi:twitching motility protein PilT